MVQIQKLIQGYHLPVTGIQPNRHTTNNRPPNIGDKLTWSNLKLIQHLHDEGMNKKTETAQEVSHIKTHFPVGEITSLFTQTWQSDGSSFRELDPLPITLQMAFFKGTRLKKSMQRPRG